MSHPFIASSFPPSFCDKQLRNTPSRLRLSSSNVRPFTRAKRSKHGKWIFCNQCGGNDHHVTRWPEIWPTSRSSVYFIRNMFQATSGGNYRLQCVHLRSTTEELSFWEMLKMIWYIELCYGCVQTWNQCDVYAFVNCSSSIFPFTRFCVLEKDPYFHSKSFFLIFTWNRLPSGLLNFNTI